MSFFVLIVYILKTLSVISPLSTLFCRIPLQDAQMTCKNEKDFHQEFKHLAMAGFPMADQKSNSKVWSEFYFELLFALGTKMKKRKCGDSSENWEKNNLCGSNESLWKGQETERKCLGHSVFWMDDRVRLLLFSNNYSHNS